MKGGVCLMESRKEPRYRLIHYMTVMILIMLMTACETGEITQPTSTPTADASQTQQAIAQRQTISFFETLAAGLTQTAQITPTASPTLSPTRTPIPPTMTPSPTITPTEITCNWANFVRDVTIPDGTEIRPGATFRKTWRLQNFGACSWTADYDFVFVEGQSFNAPLRVGMPKTVDPGEVVEISLLLEAPTTPGEYTGYFMLADEDGDRFGVGPDGEDQIWVNIVVQSSDEIAYSFVENYCDGEWQTRSTNPLACPGSETENDTGYVVRKENLVREEGGIENEPSLVTSPDNAVNGYIFGVFPNIRVQEGDLFKSVIGCEHDSPNCNLVFELRYQISGGTTRTLASWHQVYDGQIDSVTVNLSELAGYTVNFILYVENNGTAVNNRGFWIAPRIMR